MQERPIEWRSRDIVGMDLELAVQPPHDGLIVSTYVHPAGKQPMLAIS